MEKICKVCNKIFKADIRDHKRGLAKYCSRKCSFIGQVSQVETQCLTCGKLFFRFKSKPRKYCSHSCFIEAIKNKISIKCVICGNNFLARPDNIKLGGGKFCSRKCYGIWESINRIGPNSATWKGGITPIRELIRNSRQYRIWRNTIISRDKICVKCGSCKELCAHHKRKFRKYIEEIRSKMPLLSIYEASMLYKPLWDISNGETLCNNCHKQKHGWKSKLISLPDKEAK